MKSKMVLAVVINEQCKLEAIDTPLNVTHDLLHLFSLLLLGQKKPLLQPLNEKSPRAIVFVDN